MAGESVPDSGLLMVCDVGRTRTATGSFNSDLRTSVMVERLYKIFRVNKNILFWHYLTLLSVDNEHLNMP